MEQMLPVVYVAFLVWVIWWDLRTLTIPAEITLFGTLAGLIAVTFFGNAVLPQQGGHSLNFYSGLEPLLGTYAKHDVAELLLGLLVICFWFLACIHYPARFSRGFLVATRLWLRHAYQNARRRLHWLSLLFVIWFTLTIWAWKGPAWDNLFNSLVGCGFGMLTCWICRIGLSLAARQEALGFGDVHLQGMIGAWGGWQICFLNPVVGVIVLLPFVVLLVLYACRKGGRAFPFAFGPFLAIGAIATHFGWWKIAPVYAVATELTCDFGLQSAVLVVGSLFFFMCFLLGVLLRVRR